MYITSYIKRAGKNILVKYPKRIIRFFEYLGELVSFRRQNDDRLSVNIADLHPCLTDKITTTPFDQHYTYHPAWAARILAETKPAEHIDISSILNFSAIVSAFIPTKFYDYRPAHLQLSNYSSDFADLNKLPFEDGSLESLSCMRTVEHIGLGRYGDQLDPTGDVKAINELKRVVRSNGTLLFVTPVGRPKIVFNAHRIYSFEQIKNYFEGFELKEFSLIPDKGGLIRNADPALVQQQEYGCGCFWFSKTAKKT